MESITIRMATRNAAFEDGNEEREAARILRKFADQLEAGLQPEKLRDLNGNAVGIVEYEE